MSAKIISVWGSSGSGKSLVAVALAHLFNQKKKSAIVVSSDRTTPMFSCYLPFNKFDEKNSLGVLLNSGIDASSLKNKLHCNDKAKDTAFLSFGTGESSQLYPMIHSGKLESLIMLLSEYADYIICDLSSNFITEKSSMSILNYCDVTLQLLTADNMGVAFLDTYFPLIEKQEENKLQLTAISNYFTYSPKDIIAKERNIKYVLPHSKELYLSFLSGNLLTSASDSEARVFFNNLEEIVERIELYARDTY